MHWIMFQRSHWTTNANWMKILAQIARLYYLCASVNPPVKLHLGRCLQIFQPRVVDISAKYCFGHTDQSFLVTISSHSHRSPFTTRQKSPLPSSSSSSLSAKNTHTKAKNGRSHFSLIGLRFHHCILSFCSCRRYRQPGTDAYRCTWLLSFRL